MHLASAVTTSEGFRIGLLATAYGFGFRHGIDWDHIAALTDITGSQETTRRSMFFATLYALGHGLVVLLLGIVAVVLSERLPGSVDRVMERFVGATLILLGLYVISSLLRHGREFRMRSRWMLLFAGVRRAARWARARRQGAEPFVVTHEHVHPADEAHVLEGAASLVGHGGAPGVERPAGSHRHPHWHLGTMPDDPFMAYGRATSFGVGMVHGIGAETPTQILIFLAAARAGGKGAGLVLLGAFLVGLLSSNTVVALTSTFGFRSATRNFPLYAAVSVVTAVFSLAIGAIFLLGKATFLPVMFGG